MIHLLGDCLNKQYLTFYYKDLIKVGLKDIPWRNYPFKTMDGVSQPNTDIFYISHLLIFIHSIML